MRRNVLLIASRELRSFFDQPVAYVLAIPFLAVSEYIAFRELYALNLAELRPFFGLLPWLLVVFVPAITMRSLAEERRSRTLEWLVAQPLSEVEIVIGKFLGCWAFILVTLLGVLPAAIGILLVSDADPGIMFTQYLGAAFLSAQMTAIGLWASSITRNQITSFIIGAFSCFALLLIGMPVLQSGLPGIVADALGNLSVMPHVENISRGVVDFRDVLYFASVTGVFLLLTYGALTRDRLSRSRSFYRRLRLGTASLAASVLLVNLAGDGIRGRLDFTRDNLYTLSEGTKEILRNLQDRVNISFYTSPELPDEFTRLSRDVEDLLADVQGVSRGRISVERIETDPDDQEQATDAMSAGIAPVQFNEFSSSETIVRQGYFGMALTYADERESFPVLTRTDDLEYRIVSAIASMTQVDKPSVAFLTGFEAGGRFELGAFNQSLGDRYEATDIDLSDSLAVIPDSIDVVVVGAPRQTVDGEYARKLDDYLRTGGAALMMLERHLRPPQGQMQMISQETGLEDAVLLTRGISLGGDMVMDLERHARVSMGGQGPMPVAYDYPLWPIATGAEGSHATTRDIDQASFGWAAPLEIDDRAELQPLWVTGEAGMLLPAGYMIAPEAVIEYARSWSMEDLAPRTLAAVVDPTLGDDPDFPLGRIIVVADGDFIEDRFLRDGPGNLQFAANALDWLAQDESLIEIRSKDRRPPALELQSELGKGLFKWGAMAGVPLLFAVFGLTRVRNQSHRASRRWKGGAE